MEKLVEFRKSSIFKENKIIFRDFDFVVEKNKSVAIIGPSSSGKSAILKALIGTISSNGLFLLGKRIGTNLETLYKNVAVVLNDTNFVCDNVYKELAFSLSNLNISEKEIKKRVLEIVDYFKFNEYLDYDPTLLSYEHKIMLKLLSFLIISPKIIAIDDLFIYLNQSLKESIVKYLKEMNITLLITTSDIEDTLFVDYIYIINNEKIIAEGTKKSIYGEEKLLNKVGYGLPFLIELSTKLKYYGLVDKMYTSKEKLVADIWK